jgi:poly(A) polymerase
MKLREILDTIDKVAKDRGLSQPFIVGGVPRDRVRGVAKEIDDVDLTSFAGDSQTLAYAVVASGKLPFTYFQIYDDGHAAIRINDLKIDFSSHFIIDDIDPVLKQMGVKDLTPLIRETYSRDFTINTLLQDLSLQNTYDITNKGLKDISSGLIECPIDPEITIQSDPKRMLRALRFALRFDYKIAENLGQTIKNNAHLLKTFSAEYLKDKANEIVKLDKDRGVQMLIDYGLLKYIPITKLIYNVLIEKRQLYYAL